MGDRDVRGVEPRTLAGSGCDSKSRGTRPSREGPLASQTLAQLLLS